MTTPTTQSHASRCAAVIGLQWGDEGKGKIVDLLAPTFDAIVRFNGGANAGHSVVVGSTRYALHLIPSGILAPGKKAIIANGVVVDPWKVVEELDGLAGKGVDTSGLLISNRAHVVLPYHKAEDALREELLRANEPPVSDPRARRASAVHQASIGTTRRGIGPAYADKAQRAGAVRMGDLLSPEVLRSKLAFATACKRPFLNAGLDKLTEAGIHPDLVLDEDALAAQCAKVAERLKPTIVDTTRLLLEMLDAGQSVLFEGANGTLLDVDHGTYPFVTASTCVSAGVGSGAGVPASKLTRVVGVMKSYCTRVGSGPLPTELFDSVGDGIRQRGREFGTTTGRPRRVGWLDLVALRYACKLNGVTELSLTMLDVLRGVEEIRVCVAYETPAGRTDWFSPDAADLALVTPIYKSFRGFSEDVSRCTSRPLLPAAAHAFIAHIESFVGVPAKTVSVGPDRVQTILA